jgi:hypothetical protein
VSDFFQSFPIAGQDLSTPKGRQVLQDALDALYDLISAKGINAGSLDLRGRVTVRSGRGDAPLDGDSGAGLEVVPVDQVIDDAAATGKTMLRGFDLRVLVTKLIDEVIRERVVRFRVTEREDCDGRAELVDCDGETRTALGTDGVVRVSDIDGGAVGAGLPGFVADGDAPAFVQADGTVVAIAAGGGSGDLTAVQVGGAPLSVASGTGPIPVVSFTGQPLTKVDDTNVTLTLGGTPTTALAQAASITAGWTGTLAVARGGTAAGTAAGALTNLGAASQADLDALEATVAGLAGAGYLTADWLGSGSGLGNLHGIGRWEDNTAAGSVTDRISNPCSGGVEGGALNGNDAGYLEINLAYNSAWNWKLTTHPLPPNFSAFGADGFKFTFFIFGWDATRDNDFRIFAASPTGALLDPTPDTSGSGWTQLTSGTVNVTADVSWTTVTVSASDLNGMGYVAGDVVVLAMKQVNNAGTGGNFFYYLGPMQLDLTG